MNLSELVRTAARRLEAADLAYGHGTRCALDEAVWLTLWRLQRPLDTDWQADDGAVVSDSQVAAVLDLIQRRIDSRQPAAYLTGEAWLQGVPFTVDARVIVPRSFIAELIADAPEAECLDPWLGPQTRCVLDMCTGNGSLAVLAAMAWPDIQVEAVDLSPDALEVAQLNVQRHGLQDRIRLGVSDGWQAVSGRYDLVLCNPPYVSQASMQTLPAEYRAEPVISLDGGLAGSDDGMDFIRPFLHAALPHLNPQAVLVLEVGNERAHFERAFPRLEAYWPETSAGPGPVVILTREALSRWCEAQP